MAAFQAMRPLQQGANHTELDPTLLELVKLRVSQINDCPTCSSAGSTVVFGVTAGGQPTPGYQWRLNGQNLPGATSATLVLQNVGAAQAGSYMVIASNSSGSVTSAPASLAVHQISYR